MCLFCWSFHNYIWLYPLKQKSQVKDIFLRFKAITKIHFNQNIHTLYSNNDSEYIAFANLLTFHDISHLTTPPHTPKQNGFYERRHLHIIKTGLTLLSHASIPLSYWSYAFATTVYLINRMPTQTLNMFSPYKKNLWFTSQLLQTQGFLLSLLLMASSLYLLLLPNFWPVFSLLSRHWYCSF